MTEKPTPKYINPMVDFGFKKIFKESGKKQLIIRPLNAIFGLDITDIDIRESELLGLTEQERRATFEERFLYLMKNLPTFVEEPELWNDPYFDELMKEATFASMTFEEQEAYLASIKQKWDLENSIDLATAKGEAKKAVETARRMLAKNYPISEIVDISGLTEEQVQTLM